MGFLQITLFFWYLRYYFYPHQFFSMKQLSKNPNITIQHHFARPYCYVGYLNYHYCIHFSSKHPPLFHFCRLLCLIRLVKLQIVGVGLYLCKLLFYHSSSLWFFRPFFSFYLFNFFTFFLFLYIFYYTYWQTPIVHKVPIVIFFIEYFFEHFSQI